MLRRLALAGLGLAACFTGDALRGEPCSVDADCGPTLRCLEDGLCDEYRCPREPIELSFTSLAPDVTLIVAFTPSMNNPRSDDPESTRWQQVLGLVEQLSAALGDRVQLGLQVVPTVSARTNRDPCDTDASTRLLPGPDQGDEVLAALAPVPPPLGEHALRTGLELTLAGFDLQDPDGRRPQAVVLISDRPLNCSDAATSALERVVLFDNELAPRVAEAAAAGVPVYVVGVDIVPTDGTAPFPGATFNEVDPHVAFNLLADAGGQARPGDTRYYRPADADALIAALAAIPPAFADCRLDLGAAPFYWELLVIAVAGARLRGEPDCSDGHGWRWLDPADRSVVELCAATCEQFRATRALTIEQRCPPQ